MFAVRAEENCPPPENFKFSAIELKLNLDGNSKPDALVRFNVEGDKPFLRRAVILDAPAKIERAKPEQWIEPCQEEGLEARVEYEKRAVGGRDLLLLRDTTSFRYFGAQGGKLKPVFQFSNPNMDGQFSETHNDKKLLIRITGDGDLQVDGNAVDLDQRALKARCRVRELYIQLKYEWDRKTGKFHEVDQGCVMGAAID